MHQLCRAMVSALLRRKASRLSDSTTATWGRSTKLDGYRLLLARLIMADDAVAVLDAVGVDKAHVMGCSMGGMIVQRLAIDHGDRLLSMTSVMSRTGEPGYGDSSEAALAFLMAPPAPSSIGLYRQSSCCVTRVRVEARMAGRQRDT